VRGSAAMASAAGVALLLSVGGCAALVPVPPPAAATAATAPVGPPHRVVTVTPVPEVTAGTPTLRGFSDYERAALRIRNISCEGVSRGSGFAVADRVIVTNRHVAEGATSLEVETYDGHTRVVQTAGAVSIADLAIIRTTQALPATLPLAPANPRRGARITVVGFPGAGQLTTTTGTVLGYGPDGLGLSDEPMLVNDAPIQPGSSGSPLVDDAGRVVGVAYAGSRDGGPNLAVPVDLLSKVIAGGAQLSPVRGCA
jgi:S1-C subfamily serine protease